LKAVHLGHDQVKHHHVGLSFTEHPKSLLSTRRPQDVIVLFCRGQHAGKELQDLRFVVHQEHTLYTLSQVL